MIVCLCTGVPEHRILASIERGACRVEDLVQDCGAGRDCGACVAFLEALLLETQSVARV
jgi:bacterioferritin-associated ferredoxin